MEMTTMMMMRRRMLMVMMIMTQQTCRPHLHRPRHTDTPHGEQKTVMVTTMVMMMIYRVGQK